MTHNTQSSAEGAMDPSVLAIVFGTFLCRLGLFHRKVQSKTSASIYFHIYPDGGREFIVRISNHPESTAKCGKERADIEILTYEQMGLQMPRFEQALARSRSEGIPFERAIAALRIERHRAEIKTAWKKTAGRR